MSYQHQYKFFSTSDREQSGLRLTLISLDVSIAKRPSSHQPGTAEDLRHLLIVNRLVHENVPVDLAGLWIDDGVSWRGTHTSTSLAQTYVAYGAMLPSQ